jgi:endonuclease YncB( thermonuclease family)
MRHESVVAALSLFIECLAEAAILAPKGATVTVLPTKITDGDTINAVYNGATFKLRLACIDAPETWHKPYGLNSKAALIALVPLNTPINALVRQTNDGYGRSVVELISITGGGNINISMVKQGQAFVEPRYVAQCGAAPYVTAEAQAAASKTGVWVVPGGITRPWICRQTPTLCRTTFSMGRKMLATV